MHDAMCPGLDTYGAGDIAIAIYDIDGRYEGEYGNTSIESQLQTSDPAEYDLMCA